MKNWGDGIKPGRKTITGIVLTVLLIGTLTLVLNVQQARAGRTWHIEIVDSTGFSKGGENSLALDSSDNPHISYYGIGEPTGLYYAHYNGASWHIECVDSTHNSGHETSIALDSNDNPHISYSNYGNGEVMYAYYDGSSWHIEMVDSGGLEFALLSSSIALDSNDNPHISYHDHINEDLKYAYHDGANWNVEVVDSVGGYVGGGSSIALDANDNPHISYERGDISDLKYAYHDGTSWHIETVDGEDFVYVGMNTSIALDSNDNPHISYREWINNLSLKYAYHDGTNWHIARVDSAGDVGWHCSIALDSNDNPHISHFDADNLDLKYAYRDGTNWNIETVDASGNVGYYTSIALDSYDKPHISYHHALPIKGLKYAYLSPCQVSPTALDFDLVTVGSDLTKAFTITNIYGDTLSGSVTELCDHYRIVSGEGVFSLAAGESLTVTVRFEPDSAGQHNCTIETGSALCSDISCTGVGEWTAKIELTPPSHHFSTVKVGNCSEEKEFYLESIGTQTATGTLHITDGDAGHFVITEPDALDFSLPPGVTLTIKVKFCPKSRGYKAANLLADGANCNDDLSSLDGYGWKRSSCPYVSGWNGEKLVRDNNILPQSEQVGTGEDVTDYYLLRVPLQPKAGEYHIRIEEFENEHTYADRFELAIIDHPRDLHLGVTDDGEVFTYRDLMAPNEVTSSLGVDYYELITQTDGRSARIQANEIVILNFGPVNSPYGARLVVDTKTDHTDVPGQTSFRKVPLISYNDANPPREILLRSRENRAVTVGDVTSLLPSDGQDFIIKLYFPAGHRVDFIGLDLSEKVALEVKRISLASAIHSKEGAVTSKLSLTDGVYAELVPREQMDLFFKAPEERTGHRRDFILISRGHYFKYSRSSRIPQKFILAQNYPNPVNATTEIKYGLPVESDVNLTIYNLIGQKVRILVNEHQTVGYKVLHWDGRNERGSEVSSGIYFYRLKAGDFVKTRKMILLK